MPQREHMGWNPGFVERPLDGIRRGKQELRLSEALLLMGCLHLQERFNHKVQPVGAGMPKAWRTHEHQDCVLRGTSKLVGGWPTPLSKSVGMIIPNIWKNEKFSKPPTSKGNGFSRLARRTCLPITPSWFVLCCVAAQCFQCMCHATLLNWQQKTSKNTSRRNRLKMGRLFQCNFMKPSGS